ncbi:MAG TPA: hypothetical protein VF662_15335 [Allosphingosinicella sp.]|jgi:hypothetical protein
MKALSITTAWNETARFVKDNLGALFTIAFALMALPSIVVQALAPRLVSPEGGAGTGLWVLLMVVVVVLSIVGTLAISALALDRENVVGKAIALGFRRFLPLFGASLLVGLAAVILMIPLILLLGIAPEDMAPGNREAAGRIALAMLLFLIVFLFVWIRLMLMTAVAAAESGGPVAILRRSWDLTAGRFWKLLGFALLFVIAAFIMMFAATAVLGIIVALVAGRPEPDNVAGLLMLLIGGVFNAVFIVYFTTIISRIYLQLAGRTSGS